MYPNERLARQEEQIIVADTVLSLPIKLREIVVFYFYYDYTFKEIVALLLVPDSTVKYKMKKTKMRLKDRLPKERWEVLVHELEA